jgi:RNA binding exosome subunit
MKWVHRVTITVFAKPDENKTETIAGLKALVPFNLEDTKIKVEDRHAEGFNQRKIDILTITLTKEAHTNDFLQFLLDTLNKEQKGLLISQAGSRLDEELDYFIRIEKDNWIQKRQLLLTESGNCYHIKLSLAAFPKKRETALKLAERIFSQKNI